MHLDCGLRENPGPLPQPVPQSRNLAIISTCGSCLFDGKGLKKQICSTGRLDGRVGVVGFGGLPLPS